MRDVMIAFLIVFFFVPPSCAFDKPPLHDLKHSAAESIVIILNREAAKP